MQRSITSTHCVAAKRPVGKLYVTAGLALLIASLSLGRAAQPAAKAPAEMQYVKSVFSSTPGLGKDPFFPKSTRWTPKAPTTAIPTAVSFNFLSLKGVSGPKNKRLAIINNRTFEAGEEADLKVNGQFIHLKCLEIRDDGVIVSINDQTQKLSLGAKP